MKKYLRAVLLLSFLVSQAGAQQGFTFSSAKKAIDVSVAPAKVKRGQSFTIRVNVQLNEGWYTYAANQPDPNARGSATKIVFPPALKNN